MENVKAVLLRTTRTGYTPEQTGRTLTVGALIEMLEAYDEDTPIYFENDNGYTYGNMWYDTVTEYYEEDEDNEA